MYIWAQLRTRYPGLSISLSDVYIAPSGTANVERNHEVGNYALASVYVASVMVHMNVKLQLHTMLANWTGRFVLKEIDCLEMFYNILVGWRMRQMQRWRWSRIKIISVAPRKDWYASKQWFNRSRSIVIYQSAFSLAIYWNNDIDYEWFILAHLHCYSKRYIIFLNVL